MDSGDKSGREPRDDKRDGRPSYYRSSDFKVSQITSVSALRISSMNKSSNNENYYSSNDSSNSNNNNNGNNSSTSSNSNICLNNMFSRGQSKRSW